MSKARRASTNVVFLVNGDSQSAMADRARAFANLLQDGWRIDIVYRDNGRFRSIAKFLATLSRERPSVIWVFDMALAGVVAGAISRFAGTRVVVDTGDAITALARKAARGSANVAATAALEQLALRTADAIVVRGSEHQKLLRRRGVDATVIPDGVDMLAFRATAAATSAWRARLALQDQLVVGLIGSIVWNPVLNLIYGWDLVEALHRLQDLPISAVIVGDGSGLNHLQSRAAELGVSDRIRFVGRQPMDSLPELLNACDVCISTQTNDIVGQVRTTGKLPLYMASGRYVLASRVGEAARVLPEEMLIDYEGSRDDGYPERLAARLRTLCADRGRLSRGLLLPEIARLEFSYDVLAMRVENVLDRLISPGSMRAPAEESA